ncbi:unnamed protein product, partial [Brenthis ino]
MSETVKYSDILKPRNIQFGIFKFMTRSWEPKKTVTLGKYYSPQEIKKVVAESVYIDAYLEAESARSGAPKEQLRKEVFEYLEEIAMDKKMHIIRWMGIMFLKICFMMKIGVFVNEPALLKIKSSMGKNPILFLPTHRSYADFCLMTYLCFHYDIELPAVAAGMDFYSMAVIGQSMRETGAFYIRRTLVGSPLYAATLRHYVRTLVAKHYAPVEFFLEGTRSRSNMSLLPKYGMLSMSLVPYFAREVADVTIVPVNISYDRLMEQSLFAFEHMGVPKPKETTGGFLKSLYRLNDNYGNIYINLGDPISLREYLGQDLPFSSETLKPLDLQHLTTEQFKYVQDIADYTVSMQQESTVVTISNLICIILMESIIKNEVLSLEQVSIKIEWLIQILRTLGASVFENDVKTSIDRILLVHKKIMKLDGDNKLRLVSGTLMDVSPEVQKKMKGHILKAETMVNAIPIIELQLYVNPVLHYLVPPAIVYLAVLKGENTIEGLSADYHRLRKLLRYEFFHLEKTEKTTFNKALEYCVQNKVITDTYRNGSEESLQLLLQWTVTPALTTLANCVEVMAEHKKCEHRQALRLVQERAETRRLHPYCLSLESIANCLQGLALNGTVTKRRK